MIAAASTRVSTRGLKLLCASLLAAGSFSAQAGIFDDEEARKAILDLRQRVEVLRQNSDDAARKAADELVRLNEENAQLRRSLLDLQNQIESIRQDQARLRGQDEQLARDLSEVQRRQKDLAGGVEERLRKFEPVKVTVDGREFLVEPVEKRDFESALAVFRKGEFVASQAAFFDFLKRYAQSGYAPSAFFWLANAQYANREYKESMANFKALVSQFPEHLRAPEAMLSIANCQAELKDSRGAKKTLEDLVKTYPQSEAAIAGKERLARLK